MNKYKRVTLYSNPGKAGLVKWCLTKDRLKYAMAKNFPVWSITGFYDRQTLREVYNKIAIFYD